MQRGFDYKFIKNGYKPIKLNDSNDIDGLKVVRNHYPNLEIYRQGSTLGFIFYTFIEKIQYLVAESWMLPNGTWYLRIAKEPEFDVHNNYKKEN